MAKLLLQGEEHDIELTIDDEDGGVNATCLGMSWNDLFEVKHDPCEFAWRCRYDDLRDAYEYASDHADTLRA